MPTAHLVSQVNSYLMTTTTTLRALSAKTMARTEKRLNKAIGQTAQLSMEGRASQPQLRGHHSMRGMEKLTLRKSIEDIVQRLWLLIWRLCPMMATPIMQAR